MITPVKTKAGTFFLESSNQGNSKLYFPKKSALHRTGADGTVSKDERDNLKKAAAALQNYFKGAAPVRAAFSAIKFDLSDCTSFQKKVLRELQKVPPGKTTTYGELAKKAGSARAARAVGSVMNKNRIPILLPCHRVVGASGALVGYTKGLGWKRKLLDLEGFKKRLLSGHLRWYN